MQRSGNVIVDTSIWVDYLRGRDVRQREAIASLLQNGRVYMCGVVLAELLAGTRTEGDRDRIATLFRGLPYLEFSRPTWTAAGLLSANLRSRGNTIPFADLLIGALALENGYGVFTRDAHFQSIPNVSLYQPA